MADTQRRNWTEDETTLALDLYRKIPFSKIKEHHPAIIELSELTQRTPTAVKMKMFNLASCDQAHKDRGVSSLGHGSKMDYDVYNAYADHLGELAFNAAKIRAKLENKPIESYLINASDLPLGENQEEIVKIRMGQEFFRSAVLLVYSNKCCITGLSNTEMLIASHIRPWSVSSPKERTNPCNGLALNSFHDRAFDQGLITISLDYKVRISTNLAKENMDDATWRWLKSYDGIEIKTNDYIKPCRDFLEYHNDVIFKG